MSKDPALPKATEFVTQWNDQALNKNKPRKLTMAQAALYIAKNNTAQERAAKGQKDLQPVQATSSQEQA